MAWRMLATVGALWLVTSSPFLQGTRTIVSNRLTTLCVSAFDNLALWVYVHPSSHNKSSAIDEPWNIWRRDTPLC